MIAEINICMVLGGGGGGKNGRSCSLRVRLNHSPMHLCKQKMTQRSQKLTPNHIKALLCPSHSIRLAKNWAHSVIDHKRERARTHTEHRPYARYCVYAPASLGRQSSCICREPYVAFRCQCQIDRLASPEASQHKEPWPNKARENGSRTRATHKIDLRHCVVVVLVFVLWLHVNVWCQHLILYRWYHRFVDALILLCALRIVDL